MLQRQEQRWIVDSARSSRTSWAAVVMRARRPKPICAYQAGACLGQRIIRGCASGSAAGCLRVRGATAIYLLVLLTSLRAMAAGSAATPVAGGADESATPKCIDVIHEGDRSADPAHWKQWRASKGVYRLAMTYQEFYRLTGRPDLAEQDSSRRTISTVTTVVGLAGFLAGIVVAPWRYFEHDRVDAVLGLALVGGGYATLKVGEHLSRPAILGSRGGRAGPYLQQHARPVRGGHGCGA